MVNPVLYRIPPVSTRSRPKAAGCPSRKLCPSRKVSTRSRPKAAGLRFSRML